MEKSSIKLTEDEIGRINSLSEEYRSFVFKCGEVHLQIAEAKSLLQELESREKSILSNIETLKNKEKDLINSILAKYGEGTISIKDGIFIPE